MVIMQESGGVLVDARGLRCPLPLLRLKQHLNQLSTGEQLLVLTTDPGSVRDFQVFLKQAGHILLEQSQTEEGFRFLIRKGGIS